MKKAILSIGLFTLVLVSTSFAAPKNSTADNSVIVYGDGTGGQDSGGNKKVDYNGSGIQANKTNNIVAIDGTGGQDSGGNKKVD